jgi:NADH dehydrogenase
MKGVMATAIDSSGVTYKRGDAIERLLAKTVLWTGGVVANTFGNKLAECTKAETDRTGRIKVQPDLTISNYPDIFVVGDLAAAEGKDGKPLPGVAQVAIQGGSYAAKTIRARLNGKKDPSPFRYFDKGDMAVIGRAAAVANVFGLHVWGLPAWLIWLFIHLLYIVEFQNRVLVFVQWGFEYLTFNRGARLITGAGDGALKEQPAQDDTNTC